MRIDVIDKQGLPKLLLVTSKAFVEFLCPFLARDSEYQPLDDMVRVVLLQEAFGFRDICSRLAEAQL